MGQEVDCKYANQRNSYRRTGGATATATGDTFSLKRPFSSSISFINSKRDTESSAVFVSLGTGMASFLPSIKSLGKSPTTSAWQLRIPFQDLYRKGLRPALAIDINKFNSLIPITGLGIIPQNSTTDRTPLFASQRAPFPIPLQVSSFPNHNWHPERHLPGL